MSSTGPGGNEKRNVPGQPAPHQGRRTLTDAEWADARAAFGLTPRELEVVQCEYDTGHRHYIATMLGISVKTVDTHLRRAFEKIGVEDRGDLILALIHRARLAAPDTERRDSAENGETPTA